MERDAGVSHFEDRRNPAKHAPFESGAELGAASGNQIATIAVTQPTSEPPINKLFPSAVSHPANCAHANPASTSEMPTEQARFDDGPG